MSIADQKRDGLFDPVKIASNLTIRPDELAVFIGFGVDVTRQEGWSWTPLVQGRMNALSALMDRIRPRFETQALANAWYLTGQPPGFSGMTARDLVIAGRYTDVIDYVDGLNAGVFA
jgi:hypothetical protein